MENKSFTLLALLTGLLLSACSFGDLNAGQTHLSWNQAKAALKTGNVAMVIQTHAKTVVIRMKDGSESITEEPQIDDIFAEIRACGDPCKDIAIATE